MVVGFSVVRLNFRQHDQTRFELGGAEGMGSGKRENPPKNQALELSLKDIPPPCRTCECRCFGSARLVILQLDEEPRRMPGAALTGTPRVMQSIMPMRLRLSE